MGIVCMRAAKCKGIGDPMGVIGGRFYKVWGKYWDPRGSFKRFGKNI